MRSSDESSVCPSVRLSVKRVICDKMEERSVQIFIPYQRQFSLVFREAEWLVGRLLICEILGQSDHVGAKSPIFDRYLQVAPQPRYLAKKSSIKLIRSPLLAFQ